MNDTSVTGGLILNEKMLWERGKKGRSGFSLPKRDVKECLLDPELTGPGSGPDLPDLSEIDVIRHFTRLSTWNFGIDTGLYPLGSCTMKYNPKTNERQAALTGLAGSHPLLPSDFSQGALELMFKLEQFLTEITGLDAATLQPGAGAHGELAGMLMIHAWHKAKGSSRSKIIIPDTAHGTNPASAALCGFTPVHILSNEKGILSSEDVAAVMDDDTAGIMVTNPNTLGLFEENIVQITELVHAKGGLVYCDGANLNAVMGIVDMKRIGIDIMHLNLHKTFSTPHGGGGPGSGPVCVTKMLEPFLPVPRVIKKDGKYILSEEFPNSIGRLLAFHGHFSVLVKAYSYILSMGAEGLKKASSLAVLNANYIKEKLKDLFHLPFDRPCMHEVVFSDHKQEHNKVSTLDIAKRLMDFGFHPPTIYFPLVVKGAIMIEPTETESKDDIDSFIAAMRTIAHEADNDPEILRQAPSKCKVKRMDETTAARKPQLCG
jgi:glycine dehydrogenase subunit 2